jgi:hypothetical protein
MEQDARYAFACRMCLLAGAAIHWVGAAVLLLDHLDTTSTWQYAPPAIREVANALLHFLARV